MSATTLVNALIYLIVVVVIVILIIIVLKFLLNTLMILPFAYAQTTEDTNNKIVDKETKTIDIGNNTEVIITCTSNIPDLVSCD